MYTHARTTGTQPRGKRSAWIISLMVIYVYTHTHTHLVLSPEESARTGADSLIDGDELLVRCCVAHQRLHVV